MDGGRAPAFAAYDRSEIDAELSRWDIIKVSWNDAESNRIEQECFFPMRDLCARLGDVTEDARLEVARISEELDALR